MKWADFLTKLKDFGAKITKNGSYVNIELMVASEKKHTTEHVIDHEGSVDNVDVTRILNRFELDERLFRDHHV